MKLRVKTTLLTLLALLLVAGLAAVPVFASNPRDHSDEFSPVPRSRADPGVLSGGPGQAARGIPRLALGNLGHSPSGPAGDAYQRIPLPKHLVQVVAQEFGLEVTDVVAQLQEGSILAQMIEANGGTVEQIVDTFLQGPREKLQQAVDSERITQEQMDRLEEQITHLISSPVPPGLLDNQRHPRHRGISPVRQLRHLVQVVAQEFGLEATDVVAQLQEGNTLAQIIEANGGTVEQIVDTFLQGSREKLQQAVDADRITQEQMDQMLVRLEEQITHLINNPIPPGLLDHPRHRGISPVRQFRHLVQVVAQEFGLEATDVVAQLQEGSTLAQIIEASGGTVEQIVDTFLQGPRGKLQQAVDSERITQEQMDRLLDRLEEQITRLINNPVPPGPR